jgi:hypothetical protein
MQSRLCGTTYVRRGFIFARVRDHLINDHFGKDAIVRLS